MWLKVQVDFPPHPGVQSWHGGWTVIRDAFPFTTLGAWLPPPVPARGPRWLLGPQPQVHIPDRKGGEEEDLRLAFRAVSQKLQIAFSFRFLWVRCLAAREAEKWSLRVGHSSLEEKQVLSLGQGSWLWADKQLSLPEAASLSRPGGLRHIQALRPGLPTPIRSSVCSPCLDMWPFRKAGGGIDLQPGRARVSNPSSVTPRCTEGLPWGCVP